MSDAQLSFRKSANIDRVTDKRKDSLFRLVDTDGSGTIDAQEFAVLYDAIKKDLAEELEKEAALAKEASSAKRRFKMLLLFVAVLVSFLAASVAANFAVIFAVVDQAITTTTTSTGVLEVKGSDVIAKTATATQDVPLIIAPALDLETLGQVKSLAVKYADKGTVEASLTIVAVRKHNATFVEFVSSDPSEMVQALNGQAFLVTYPTLANGYTEVQKRELCAANATCSAFRASGIDVDAAFELAKEELSKAGFEEVSRRLEGWSTPYMTMSCAGGSWYLVPVCGYAYTPTTVGTGWWTNFGNCFPSNPLQPPGWWYNSNYPYNYPATWGPAEKPPPKGSVAIYSHNGYSATRHLVFFLHGKAQRWSRMYSLYCTSPTGVPETEELVTHSENGGNGWDTPCPELSKYTFKHLIFVFAGAGKIDAGFGGTAGWSTAIYQSQYGESTTAMVTDLLTHVMDGAAAPSVTVAGTTYSPDWAQHYTGAPAIDPTETEIMSIGFSDGAGMSMYMQWMGAFTNETRGITQVIAIDYWAHNVYDQWLTNWGQYQNPSWLPGALDAKIYTNCYSGIFRDNGPMAIFEDKAIPGETTLYPVMGGFSQPSTSAGYWKAWNWIKPNCQRFQFWVHGLDSHVMGSPTEWKGNSSWWTDTMCTATNQMTVPVNGSVHWSVATNTVGSVLNDIDSWRFKPKGRKIPGRCQWSIWHKADDGKILAPSQKVFIEDFQSREEKEEKDDRNDDARGKKGRRLSSYAFETMEDIKGEAEWAEKKVFKVPVSTSKYTISTTTPAKAVSRGFVNVYSEKQSKGIEEPTKDFKADFMAKREAMPMKK